MEEPKYEIGESLYANHLGEVFRGRYKPLDRKLVITQLSDVFSALKNRMRLVREINLIRQIQSPFVCALLDVSRVDDKTVLVQEFGDFKPISSVFESTPPSEPLLQQLFLQLLLAVELINSKQLCIFPSFRIDSVFVDEHELVRLADFSVMPGKDELDRTVTPFTPPEVLRTTSKVTKASDVWVLGVLLYFLATKEYPFEGDCLRGHMKPPAGASPQLVDLLQRMLQKKEETRITLEEIKSHPWMAPFAEQMKTIAIRIERDRARTLAVDKGIVAEMAKMGYQEIDTHVLSGNESSECAVVYKILLREQTMKQFVEFMEGVKRAEVDPERSLRAYESSPTTRSSEGQPGKQPGRPGSLKVFFPRGATRKTVGTRL